MGSLPAPTVTDLCTPAVYKDILKHSMQKQNPFNVTCAKRCLDTKQISMTILEENTKSIKINMPSRSF